MAAYTVRIELHGSGGSDYTELHAAMDVIGFTRTIRGKDKAVYELPTAEYNYIDDESDIEDVLRYSKMAADFVKNVKSGIFTSYSVLITESVCRKWYNLTIK